MYAIRSYYEQVGRGQVEKVQRMRLQNLAVVHEPPDLVGGRGQAVDADHEVERLCRRQVVADSYNFV